MAFSAEEYLVCGWKNVASGGVEKRGAAEFEKAAKPKKGQTQKVLLITRYNAFQNDAVTILKYTSIT